jgi:hypothetical protein
LHAFWPLLTPVIILGGILGGVITPTEAAAVAVGYAWSSAVRVAHADMARFARCSDPLGHHLGGGAAAGGGGHGLQDGGQRWRARPNRWPGFS